ncbi:MAG: hypothetical protein EPO68_14775 [Planctomycetota bacterium]|nr:MAG: hypothetical protein EPO68_14775 [Planctomycetota bacterium]
MKHHVRCAGLVTLALASRVAAQGNERNPLRLHNGEDKVVILPTPQPVGDYVWKVFPREVLRHPTGSLHLSGIEFHVFDRNPATASNGFDVLLTPAIPSVSNPGALEPDLANPLYTVALPNGIKVPGTACTNAAALITIQPLQPIQILADGTMDYALVITQPPCASTPSPCGPPDCTWVGVYSDDEQGADVLANGLSPYGGMQAQSLGGQMPDPYNYALAAGLQFVEPILAIRTGQVGAGAPQDLGLAGVNLPLSVSSRMLAYTVRAIAPAGNVAIAASSLMSPLPGMGFPLYGAGWLLNPGDPVLAPTLRLGAFTPPSSFPTKSLMFESNAPIPLNAGAIGVVVYSHAFVLDPLLGLARASNLVRTNLLP